MKIIVPIIKLKTEQTKQEMKNQILEVKLEKFSKIYNILLDQINKSNFDLSSTIIKL